MGEEKEAQKKKKNQMGPPPLPIIEGRSSCNNNNDSLIVARHNQQVNEEGDNKTTSSRAAGHGGRKKTTTGDMHIWTERERRKKMRNMFTDLHALLPHLPPKADKTSIVDEAVRYIKVLENTLEDLEKKKQERLKQLLAQKSSADECSTTTIVYDSYVHNISSKISREAFMADHGSGGSSSPSIINNNNNLASTTVIGTSSLPSLSGGGVVNDNNNPPVGFQTWTSTNVVVNICGDQAQFNVCSLKKKGLFTSICAVFEKYKIQVLSAHVSSDDRRVFFMIHARANQFEEAFPAVKETFRQAAGEMTLWLS